MSDDWIDVLRRACDEQGQKRTAQRIGYSAAAVCSVLKGRYAADTAAIEAAVRGRLMAQRIDCPIMAEPITRDVCVREQRALQRAAADPLRQAFRRTCPTCRHAIRRMGS